MRRGVRIGIALSFLFAATTAAHSEDRPVAFLETLGVCLVGTLLAVAVVRAIQVPGQATAVTGDPYAGFLVRALAFAFDYVPLSLVALLLEVTGLHWIGVPVLVGLAFLYFVGFWATVGQTPGMRSLGLRVVRENGGDVTPAVAVRRFVGLFVAFACLCIGVVWVAFDPQKRGWADRFGGTVVVRAVSP